MRQRAGKGIITIAFDDAYLEVYRHAIRYLDKVNVKSTVAIAASLIGKTFENRRVVGLKELQDIVKSGHEVASHTLTHPNLSCLSLKDKERAAFEIAASKSELQRFLKRRVGSFVFPYIKNNVSQPLRLKTRDYYESARVTSERPFFNRIPLKDPYSIVGFAVMKKYSLPYLNKQIDYAARKKRWLIEVFHLVSNKNTLSSHRPKPYRFFMHIDDFKKHIDYILSKGVTILTQAEAVKKFGYGI